MTHNIHNTDCMELTRSFPDKYFELAVVDPPYGIGDKLTQGGTWASKYKAVDAAWDIAPKKEYWNELFRVSKNQIVWGGNYFGLPPNRCFIIWDKIAHMDTLADCEYAWTSFDKNAKIFKHVRNTSEGRIHICQKPVKLYDWIFKNYLPNGGKVLDTHGGSMSSVISAIKAGNIEMTCSELDKDYFKAAKERILTFQSQLDMFAPPADIIFHE
jgi:site-specific DNA-methyltransferase (adenine-specific)